MTTFRVTYGSSEWDEATGAYRHEIITTDYEADTVRLAGTEATTLAFVAADGALVGATRNWDSVFKVPSA